MAEFERVRYVFDVGAVVRDLQEAYVPRDAPVHIAPQNLQGLIAWLREVTEQTRLELEDLWSSLSVGASAGATDTGPTLQQAQQIRQELIGWQLRLGIYEAAITSSMAINPTDAQLTLWTVVAPLFFGFYDGAHGKKTGTADLRTPLILANQVAALRGFREDKLVWSQLWRDLVRSTKELPGNVSDAVAGTLRALGEAAGKAAGGLLGGLGIDLGQAVTVIGVGAFVWWWFTKRKEPRRSYSEAA